MSFLWPWLKKNESLTLAVWKCYHWHDLTTKEASVLVRQCPASETSLTLAPPYKCIQIVDMVWISKRVKNDGEKNLAFWKIGLEQLVNQWQSIESGVSCCWERSRHEHVGSGNSDGRIHFLFRKDNPFNIHSIIFNISLLLLQVSSACMQVYTRSSATTWQYQEHRPVFCVKVKETMGFLRPVHTLLLLLVYKNHCLQ